jgi:hypothetical protein
MALKIFRAVWFLSVLAVLGNLLFSYASWQQEELVILEDGIDQLFVNKEVLFYAIVGILVLVNVVVYVFGKLYAAQEDLRCWIHALVISINIFFIVSVNLVGLYNSAEKFNYGTIEFIIYGSVGLIVFVALIWPVYSLSKKFFVKEAVQN